jgi:hypothetical protein
MYTSSSERLGDFKFEACNPTLQNALKYIISGQQCYCLKDIFHILHALGTTFSKYNLVIFMSTNLSLDKLYKIRFNEQHLIYNHSLKMIYIRGT